MIRFLASTIAVSVVMITILHTPVRAGLDAEERAQTQQMIEQFIKDNPELLRDALVALAAREEAKRLQAGIMAVRDDAGDPVMGNPDGSIIVYEFSDYNCGYCKRVFPDLMAVLEADPSLRLVIKEFPILAESSVLAARAAIAAQAQKKFPAFHKALMGWRGRLDGDAINDVAKKVGLDTKQLQKDMQDERTDFILSRTRQAASALDLRGTPALIIGKNIIPGAIGREEILSLIKQAKADKNS